ncbi:hypothetical protein D3C87_1832110 [compost metagenome]
MVTCRAMRRPWVSARRPISAPPRGRARKPTPNVAKLASRPATSSPWKNFLAMVEARKA